MLRLVPTKPRRFAATRARIPPRVWAGAAAALGALCAATVWAATMRPGDVVLVAGSGASCIVASLDPATLDTTMISSGGLISSPGRVAVDKRPRILVTDMNAGVVEVDPATGSQSVLASILDLGGDAPFGICVAPDGGLYLTIRGLSPRVLHLGPNAGQVQVVSSGGLLSYPGSLAIGPDGALYVCEGRQPVGNGGGPGFGSIVRVDPASGAQALIAADPLFFGPFDIAITEDGTAWTAQNGMIAGRHGCFIRTRLADGASEQVQGGYCRSQGIAMTPGGTIILGDCRTIGPDCYYPYTYRYPDGPQLYGLAGPLAPVPAGVTHARRTSWGTLKTIYR